METFEYRTVILDGRDMERSRDIWTTEWNRWGKDGWELVSSLGYPCLGSSRGSLVGVVYRVTLIFKRRNQSGEAAG